MPPTISGIDRLERLRGTAPKRNPNVRALARYAANSACRLAALGFAARVDFDQLLLGTKFAGPFGQSPFAFRRGNRFEERLRENAYAPLLGLLGDTLGYAVEGARVEPVRSGFARSPKGMEDRVARTAELVGEIVAGRRGAPNLLDGAMLTHDVGGVPAFFEADAVAARFEEPIHVGEIKSFPTVDGQADPDKVGAAVAQVSIYILLMRELVDRLGGDPAIVSTDALLITPRNTGLQPTLTIKPVGREVDRARRILDQAPQASEIVADLPDDLPSFAVVAGSKQQREAKVVAGGPAPDGAEQRLDAAYALAERVGTKYGPSCLASCGMARFCRERCYEAGATERFGGQIVRLLPGIESMTRASELARGAAPAPGEAAVAAQLTRAEDLLRRSVPAPPSGRRRAR